MNTRRFALNVLAVVSLALAFASAAQAQSALTYVAEYGRDTGSCPHFLPCRTITYALSQVRGGGEVIILDNGSYEPFTITKPVNITTVPGVHAVVPVSGPLGAAIRVQAEGEVVIRGLKVMVDITNLSRSDPGTLLRLLVEDCVMDGANILLYYDRTSLIVKDTTFRRSGIALYEGADCFASHCLFEGGSDGIFVWNTEKASRAVATVRDSVAVHTHAGFVVETDYEGSVELTIENCAVTNSDIGVEIINQGAETIFRVSNSTITNNEYGFDGSPGAVIYSRGNNTVHGNRVADSLLTIRAIPGT